MRRHRVRAAILTLALVAWLGGLFGLASPAQATPGCSCAGKMCAKAWVWVDGSAIMLSNVCLNPPSGWWELAYARSDRQLSGKGAGFEVRLFAPV